MTLWAIVPVKPLRLGKISPGRGADPGRARRFNRRLLAHTLDTLTAIPEIEHVLVDQP